MPITSHTIPSPIGPITLRTDERHLIGLDIDSGVPDKSPTTHPILHQAATELDEYFAGQRSKFDTPVFLPGTSFQQAVWRVLQTIPFGQLRSYGEVGAAAGYPHSARAVGGAVGKNPIPIIVPCHRVVGSDGAITGYSGGQGIPTKRLLLSHEGAFAVA